MPGEIDEIVSERIDELATELKEARASQISRWELWVSLFSSLLAVLSAVIALLASFASDESSKMSELTLKDDVYMEGLITTKTIITTKIELLNAIGKSTNTELQNDLKKIETSLDEAELKRLNSTIEGLKKDSKKAEEKSDRYLEAHDMMVVAITLFQLHILLGGLSVMVDRISVWKIGFLFTTIGGFFLARGLIDFLSH